MKNSTTAFVIFLMCSISCFFKMELYTLLAAVIFAATYLIVGTIEDTKK